jgi:hypothetical protein
LQGVVVVALHPLVERRVVVLVVEVQVDTVHRLELLVAGLPLKTL